MNTKKATEAGGTEGMTSEERQKWINIIERLIVRFEELVNVEKYLKGLSDPHYDPELPEDFDINNVDFDSDPELDTLSDEMMRK